jgi:hypothetical protein
MMWISGGIVLAVIVVGNAAAQSQQVNGFAVAAVDLALACGAWLFVRQKKRAVRQASAQSTMMSRRTYSLIRGRNSIALAVVLGIVTIGFAVAGREQAAVRSGFLCAAAIYLAARTVWTLKRFHTEGKLDRTWPVI